MGFTPLAHHRTGPKITLSSHVWLSSGSDEDLANTVGQIEAFSEHGLDLAIVYLLPPLGPAVLEPLATALTPLR